jgi:hypothetical protein
MSAPYGENQCVGPRTANRKSNHTFSAFSKKARGCFGEFGKLLCSRAVVTCEQGRNPSHRHGLQAECLNLSSYAEIDPEPARAMRSVRDAMIDAASDAGKAEQMSVRIECRPRHDSFVELLSCQSRELDGSIRSRGSESSAERRAATSTTRTCLSGAAAGTPS